MRRHYLFIFAAVLFVFLSTSSAQAAVKRHVRGSVVVDSKGTVYFLGESLRYPFPSLEIFYSWNHKLSEIKKANGPDLKMPLGPVAEYYLPAATPAPIPPPPPSTINPITKNGLTLTGTLCALDFSLLPQSESNARRLIDFCEKIAPKIETEFGNGPRPYKIQFYIPGTGAGGTGTYSDADAYVTDKIYLSSIYWQTEHATDAAIMAHELTHAIQFSVSGTQYEAWLTEALADYGAYVAGYQNNLEERCYHFSSEAQNQYRVYGCTYKFLKFIANKYDSKIAFKLHKALQSRSYSENLFVQFTGKTYNQLLNECSQDSNCGGTFHGGL